MRYEPAVPTNPAEARDLTRLRQEVLNWVRPATPARPTRPGQSRRGTSRLQPGRVHAIPSGRAAGKKNLGLQRIASLLVVTAVAGLVAGGVGLYSGRLDAQSLRWLKWVPYPLAAVNLRVIPLSRGLAIGEISPATLQLLINEELIDQLADRYNVHVSQAATSRRLENLVNLAGGAVQFEKQVRQMFGMSTQDFTRQVLVPSILKEKVGLALLLDERSGGEPLQRAVRLASQLKNQPETFEAAALVTNEDASRAASGDLGFLIPEQLSDLFRAAVAPLQPGQVTGLLTAIDGYRILKVEAVIRDDAGQVKSTHLRQVFIAGRDLADILDAEEHQAVIWRFIH